MRRPLTTSLLALLLSGLAAAQSMPIDAPPLPWDERIVEWNGVEVVAGEVLVQFRAGTSAEGRSALHAAAGVSSVVDVRSDVELVRRDDLGIDELLQRYSQDPSVELAEPNIIYRPHYEPNDPKLDKQWGTTKIKSELAWDYHRGSSDVVVAVIDSGVDVDHPDLVEDYAWGWDYASNDAVPDDETGHGTHVAGTSAARTDNGKGVTGIGFDCRFAAYRTGNGSYPNSLIAKSIDDCVEKGAHVINMSFGSGFNSSITKFALDDAHEAGVVLVGSAGNDGDTAKNYPAALNKVIAVANSTSSDARNSGSTYGPWVSVAAPGSNIKSTYLGGGYADLWGTSMAAPHVAGMAALLYSALGGERTPENASLVRSAIEQTCDPVPGQYVEFGRVNLLNALFQLSPPPPPSLTSVTPDAVAVAAEGSVTITGNGLNLVTAIAVGDEVIPAGPAFHAVDNQTLEFFPPKPLELGPTSLSVLGPGGWSDAITLAYTETSPPQLTATATTIGGFPMQWDLAGGADDYFFLVFSLGDGATVPVAGLEILATFHARVIGVLDPLGLDQLVIPTPTGMGGTTVHSQLLTIDERVLRFRDASNVTATTILL